jgi:uncharacterized membrane protein
MDEMPRRRSAGPALRIGKDKEAHPVAQEGTAHKIDSGQLERWASVAVGVMLVLVGFGRAFRYLLVMAIGGLLAYRGLTGRWLLLGSTGVPEDAEPRPAGPVVVQRSVTVNRPVDQVYQAWHNVEEWPRYMLHLRSVRKLDGRRAQWVETLPGPLPVTVEWQSELIEDRKNEHLAWRTAEGSPIDLRVDTTFRRAPGDRGTLMNLRLTYHPSAGMAGQVAGWFLRDVLAERYTEDLRRFKRIMETGELPTTRAQPTGDGRRLPEHDENTLPAVLAKALRRVTL